MDIRIMKTHPELEDEAIRVVKIQYPRVANYYQDGLDLGMETGSALILGFLHYGYNLSRLPLVVKVYLNHPDTRREIGDYLDKDYLI